MHQDRVERRSRWVIRAMEWDDGRARYPNLWHEGMPRHLMAFDRVASRLSLGDLLAIYYPASQRHPERSDSFLGLSRVIGLRRADAAGYAWVDLETAHRFSRPMKLGAAPRRVFLCCDPGWPEPEVALFRRVFDAATAEGWEPLPEEVEATQEPAAEPAGEAEPPRVDVAVEASEETTPVAEAPLDVSSQPVEPVVAVEKSVAGRMFAGADYGGDMRDPREGTWLAVLELAGDRLRVRRLDATGRSGLQSYLRDPDSSLMHVEAIGLGFPFGLPQAFAESLIGGSFPEEGWWALVRKLEGFSRPDYLAAGQEFCKAHGEIKRFTDERAGAHSPLHRARRDLSPMTYHGIRMIGEDRSRYAIRPFENAQGKLLLEVRPEAVAERLGLRSKPRGGRAAIERLSALDRMPVDVESPYDALCARRRGAIDAIVAARCAAVAVISGEADKSPDALAPDHAERVRREGWIYGLEA